MLHHTTYKYASIGRKGQKMNVLYDDCFGENHCYPIAIFLSDGNFGPIDLDDTTLKVSAKFFAERGFLCCSIDYRQDLHNMAFEPKNILNALDHGVSDLWRVIAFVISHCEEWHADQHRISLFGKGTGACVALKAEYDFVNGRAKQAPGNFQFEIIVAHTGALATSEDVLCWKDSPCPIILLQGRQTSDIPQGRFHVPGLLWLGGESLQHEIVGANGMCVLIPVNIQEKQLTKQQDSENEIKLFLEAFVISNMSLIRKTPHSLDWMRHRHKQLK